MFFKSQGKIKLCYFYFITEKENFFNKMNKILSFQALSLYLYTKTVANRWYEQRFLWHSKNLNLIIITQKIYICIVIINRILFNTYKLFCMNWDIINHFLWENFSTQLYFLSICIWTALFRKIKFIENKRINRPNFDKYINKNNMHTCIWNVQK